MEFLGIGYQEVGVILVLLLVFVGPERLPHVAYQLGRAVKTMQSYARAVRDEFSEEITYLEEQYQTVRGEINTANRELRESTARLDAELRESTAKLDAGIRDVTEPLQFPAGGSATTPATPTPAAVPESQPAAGATPPPAAQPEGDEPKPAPLLF